ncbi:alpha-glucan family phosphorylase [Streptomyces radicis]|uniref:glycogen phosphorylase n=1 Tax=Streptomyces radicis TaxID=1750517 RepID=A0A3A9WAC6_9ACTN|nr:alpha-glucan family phosphorylase [Streptomyces radicis]RKN09313.1 alpha-glucan family phosphorylase [Streptomyces radicis]RKN23089.1 alpha-glucan family phosphorylase [Streptomyces radicis]
MKAIRRFSVRPVLPDPLRPLQELAFNLRWSWHPETRELLRSVAPDDWAAAREDPVRLLASVSADRLATLAADRGFLRRLGVAIGDLRDYLTEPRWYQQADTRAGGELPRCIAYFSPEFGITAALPQYSGGLGILAGDHLKAASDLGVPLIGVGLLYRHGYFRQSLSADGWQQEHYPVLDPHELPLAPLTEADGSRTLVQLALPGGRALTAQIWQVRVGRVPLLLLDSDHPENGPAERDVTDRLYGGGGEHRLLQEMLLGIGGMRAVRAYCRITGHAEPEVCHMNEGHAGFLGPERIRELGERGVDFDAALRAVRAGTVFTTHTPVPAGIDRFPEELVARHFGESAELATLGTEALLALGRETTEEGAPAQFNMAVLGLRTAQRANGVSVLHGQVSRGMFAWLWPGFDAEEAPIGAVTNGVHAPTWTADAMLRARAATLTDAELWDLRRTLREQLVHEVRARLRAAWRQRGAGQAELGWVDDVLDPDVLTIGFARRVPSYKRLTLMLHDRERLRGLLLHPERPVQIVVAGKAHPADDGGKRLIQELVRFADDPAIRRRIVFLPDYGMAMARSLYAGCDVWLNNPLRPLEACGTSGMKAALNGCLNLSVRDGWWDEWFDPDFGWEIPTADGLAAEEPDRRDAIEAAALYTLLDEQVGPCFYDRGVGRGGLPIRWLEMVRATLDRLGPRVLADRMLREYVTGFYAPAAASHRAMTAEAAGELAAYARRVREAWPRVAVEHVEPGTEAPTLGGTVSLKVRVALGDLDPGAVEVQAVTGRVDSDDTLADPGYTQLKPDGGPDLEGRWTFTGELTLHRPGPFGYTVRVLPSHPLLAHRAELGLMALPDGELVESSGVLFR